MNNGSNHYLARFVLSNNTKEPSFLYLLNIMYSFISVLLFSIVVLINPYKYYK